MLCTLLHWLSPAERLFEKAKLVFVETPVVHLQKKKSSWELENNIPASVNFQIIIERQFERKVV